MNEKTFPRKMLVWNNDMNDLQAEPRMVLAKVNSRFLAIDAAASYSTLCPEIFDPTNTNVCFWDNAKELPEVKTRFRTRDEVLAFVAHHEEHIFVRQKEEDKWCFVQHLYLNDRICNYVWTTISKDGIFATPQQFLIEVTE